MPDDMTPNPPPPRTRRSAFEWSLSALQPKSSVGRPSFMYQAGQESQKRRTRMWQCVAAGAAVLWLGTVATAVAWVWHVADTKVATEPVRPVEPRSTASTADLVPPSSTLTPLAVAPRLPPPPSQLPADADPTDPGQIAEAMRIRRNILVAGLGMVPTKKEAAPPKPATPGPAEDLSPTGGVFTAPKAAAIPRDKPAPPVPEPTELPPPE